MGLDISFNREEAVAAGLVLETQARATPDEIRYAREEAEDNGWDTGYIAWMEQIQEVFKVPGTAHWVENNGVDMIIVRANHWGRTYGPLAAWLTNHGIEWEEF